MKMMWFTLWSEPTGVAAGDGVGVGPPEARPSPEHPVRRNSNRKARTHASDTLLQRVIGSTWRWRFLLLLQQQTDSSSSSHSSHLMCSLCSALAELDLPSFDIPSRCSDIESF